MSRIAFVAVIIVGLLSSISFSSSYSGGTGTTGDPYQIADTNDLLALGADSGNYDKCFILTADINLQGYYFNVAVIAPDANNANNVFDGNAFTGTFDGNGHKITNLHGGDRNSLIYCNSFIGLFGCIGSNGSVKNLGIENCDVNDYSCIGGLAGENDGNISNCYVTGTVSGYAVDPPRFINRSSYNVGGLVGYNHNGSISNCSTSILMPWDRSASFVGGLVGSSDGGSISNCYSTGSVGCSGDDAGGLVGWNSSGSISYCCSTNLVGSFLSCSGGLVGRNDSGSISHCRSTGSVGGGPGAAGGLVGTNGSGSISDCCSTGDVSSAEFSAGGLVGGNASGNISNCYSTGAVSSGVDFAGGLIGSNGSGNISNCYSTSPVSSGVGYVGGLVGENESGDISDCYSTGAVLSGHGPYVGGLVGYNVSGNISNCYSRDHVSHGGYGIGGLIGYNASGSISDCCSTGAVSDSLERVGGLVGWNDTGNISNCYSTGAISGSSDSNYVSNYMGGLVGENDGNISDCYSMGAVIGSSDSNYVSNYIGGLVGENDGSISDCYSTGEVNGSDIVGGLVGENSGGIIDCYSTGEVNGSDVVGGLVGYNSGGISNCYSTGVVSGSYSVGGLVGEKSNGISNCDSTGVSILCSFWDIQTSGQTTSAGGEGKTTAEMRNINTFLNASWDFVNIWQMPGDNNYLILSFFAEPNVTAIYPKPGNGGIAALYIGEAPDVNLTWRPGIFAAKVNGHDVYFGTDYSGVANATTSSSQYKGRQSATIYLASGLEAGATYYWRIDEVNDACEPYLWKGSVWSFTTGLFIDDFERYSDTNDMSANWTTGYSVDCGSTPAGILSFVHDSAGKHANYYYDNNSISGGQPFSEARYTYGSNGVDWTGGNLPVAQRPKVLSLSYERKLGQAGNSADPDYDRMYVAIEDTAGNFNMLLNPDPDAQTHPCWQDWKIPLADLNSPNVNLKAIKYFYIGFGKRCNNDYIPGGDGNVMFDNIRLEQCGLSADFTGDCFVNFNDFAIMGEEWHRCGGQADLNHDCFVDLMDLAILADEWLK